METKRILKKIDKAISKLYRNDMYLLEHDVQEQTIAASLACYLRPLFRRYHVDVEYNRDITKV
jgi:hypothetical protein